MRTYLASTAEELQEFLEAGELVIDEVYAPTEIYASTHPEMDEEEIEYSLSLLAAEDALELRDEQSGSALVLACEISSEALGHLMKSQLNFFAQYVGRTWRLSSLLEKIQRISHGLLRKRLRIQLRIG